MLKRFLVVALYLVATPCVAVADGMQAVRHIDVSGEGRLHVKPDKADVQFTVFADDKMLAQAKKKADSKMDAVLAMLAKLGIAKGDIQTNYTSIMPRYRYENSVINSVSTGKQIFEAYEANYAITVTIKKLDLVGVVLEKLTDAGIDRIGNVGYGLVDERPIKEKVLTEAVAHAKRKADIAAGAMGVAVGGVISFAEAGAQIAPMQVMAAAPMMMKAMDASGGAPSAPPAGDIEVTQSVSISYAIKD